AEAVAFRFELLADLDVVVDLAVVEEHPVAGRRALDDRAQPAGAGIDDAEARHRQLHGVGAVVARLVRPAMLDRSSHRLDSLRIDPIVAPLADDARDCAHEISPACEESPDREVECRDAEPAAEWLGPDEPRLHPD